MEFDTQFWIQMLVYAVTFGVFYGTTTTRLKMLEAKMDKHNNIIERTFKLEDSVKSAHHRINDLRDELHEN